MATCQNHLGGFQDFRDSAPNQLKRNLWGWDPGELNGRPQQRSPELKKTRPRAAADLGARGWESQGSGRASEGSQRGRSLGNLSHVHVDSVSKAIPPTAGPPGADGEAGSGVRVGPSRAMETPAQHPRSPRLDVQEYF